MNMFQRLRDFNVPAVVLDEIFSNKKDLKTMEKSWEELKSKGMKDDEIAEAEAIIHQMRMIEASDSELNWKDMAVLYRTNAQSRAIEESSMSLTMSSIFATI